MSIRLFGPEDVAQFVALDEATQVLVLRVLGVLGPSDPAAWEQLRRRPNGDRLVVWAAALAARQD